MSANIRNLRNEFVQLINSSNYFITQEIFNNVQGIISALDSLKLDNIFLNNSAAWRKQFNQNIIKNDKSSINGILDQGSILIRELSMSLDRNYISKQQDFQIRKEHFVATEKLKAFLKEIHPYSYGAYARLNNYAMTVNLTNRYANIRNELASKEPPNDLDTFSQWANRTNPSKLGFKTPDWKDYTYGFTHKTSNSKNNFNNDNNKVESRNSINSNNNIEPDNVTTPTPTPPLTKYKLPTSKSLADININRYNTATKTSTHLPTKQTTFFNKSSNDWRKDAIEGGMYLDFPGISEQKYHYKEPIKPNYLNFVINPDLRIDLLGRKFSEALVEPISTEYQSRFKHANPIDKFPWIKQF